MRINIVGSILLTLALMLVCSLLGLGLFGSLLLMIACFAVFNYRTLIRGKLRRIKLPKRSEKFKAPRESKTSKNMFDGMSL